MAKIELRIEADSAFELQELLAGFRSGGGSFVTEHQEMSDEDAEMYARDEEAHSGDYTPPERQRRTRRTKAQIEADNAAQAEKPSTGGISPALTAPARAATGDVFGDQLKEVAAEAKPGALTLADVEAVGRQAFEKIGAAATQALIIEHGGGAKAFKVVEPQHFAALHAALSAAAGG